ncbi:hypothetical protein Rhopal_005751-T1 [Rhodotorula paludigena]|uniref:Ubiquitinyl hydrolase 1 n=1 Tax=Rhodotorula paludigena TaxID=86838 RepID=A0AAV5GJB6_9BASI|nr:hypothetical protein Rhopal_005751-T1 [Rhodotorula paludigena]
MCATAAACNGVLHVPHLCNAVLTSGAGNDNKASAFAQTFPDKLREIVKAAPGLHVPQAVKHYLLCSALTWHSQYGKQDADEVLETMLGDLRSRDPVLGPNGRILCLPVSNLPQHSHQRALDAVFTPTSVALECYSCQGLTASRTHTTALFGGVLMTVLALSKPDGSRHVFNDSTVALRIKVPIATADEPKEFVLSAIIAHAGPNVWTGHYIAIMAVALEGGKGAGVRRLNDERNKWYALFEDALKASSYGSNRFEAYICIFVNPDHCVAPVPDLSTGLPSLFGVGGSASVLILPRGALPKKKAQLDCGEGGRLEDDLGPDKVYMALRSGFTSGIHGSQADAEPGWSQSLRIEALERLAAVFDDLREEDKWFDCLYCNRKRNIKDGLRRREKKQDKEDGEYSTRRQSTAPKSTKSVAKCQTGTQQTAAVPALRNTGKKLDSLKLSAISKRDSSTTQPGPRLSAPLQNINDLPADACQRVEAFIDCNGRPSALDAHIQLRCGAWGHKQADPARISDSPPLVDAALLADICAALVVLHDLFKTQQQPQNAVYRFKFNTLRLGLVAQHKVEASSKEELASRLDLLTSASSTILASAFTRYSAMHPGVKAKTLAELGVKGSAPHLNFAINLLEGLQYHPHKSGKNCANQIMTITSCNAVKQVAVDKPHLAYWHPALVDTSCIDKLYNVNILHLSFWSVIQTLNTGLRKAVASCVSRGFGYDQVTDVVL